MSGEPHPKRRRNRLVVVCLRCRKKKAKCDKQLPCNQCMRANCADECLYDGPISANEIEELEIDEHFKKSVKRLLDFFTKGQIQGPEETPYRLDSRSPQNKYMIGESPMVPSSDKMNINMRLSYPEDIPPSSSDLKPSDLIEPRFVKVFHNFKTSLRNTFAVELSQQDPAVRIYWEHNVTSEKLKLMTIQNLEAPRRSEVVKAASRYFGPLFFSSNRLSQSMTRKQLSMYGQLLGFSYIPNYCDIDPFQRSLRKILPAKPVLLAYLRQFFAKIYPLYPVVDELWTFDQVNQLFIFSGPDDVYVSANMSSRDDVIVVSIILYMLVLSYLSYFTNIKSNNQRILDTVSVGGKLLRDVPISQDATELAASMLLKGSYRFKSLFALLQAHTLKVIYKLMSQENETAYYDVEGPSGIDSVLLMAASLMLGRDPDHVVNFPGDAKQRNLRRKVWYALIHIAYTLSYLFLSPKNVYQNLYHTKLPTFEPESSNLSDLDLEERTITQLQETHEILTAGNKLLGLTMDTKLSISGSYLVQHLNDFECFVHEKLGIIDDFFKERNLEHDADIFDIAKLKLFLSLRIYISYVTYFLHLYYRFKQNQRLSFFFLKKTLLIHSIEFSYLCSELMFSQEKYFDSSFALIISPIIMIIKQASFIICLAFSISIKCGIIVQDLVAEHSRDIQLMRSLLWKNQEATLKIQKLERVLSERYFYAWKCVKINSFGFSLINRPEFFVRDPKKLYEAALLYTDDQMKELMDCIPGDCPIKVTDPKEFKVQCYQEGNTGIDAYLMGIDLYKTLQTDNFWIILNTLAERSYASLYLPSEPNPRPSETTMPNIEIAQEEHDYDARRTSLRILDPLNNAALLEPSTLQILDMNMFSANWKADDRLQGDENGTPEDVL